MIETVDTLSRRISALLGVRRTRQDDARREANHGGSPAEYQERMTLLAGRLRSIANDLEKSTR